MSLEPRFEFRAATDHVGILQKVWVNGGTTLAGRASSVFTDDPGRSRRSRIVVEELQRLATQEAGYRAKGRPLAITFQSLED
jgi:hypothetical protein